MVVFGVVSEVSSATLVTGTFFGPGTKGVSPFVAGNVLFATVVEGVEGWRFEGDGLRETENSKRNVDRTSHTKKNKHYMSQKPANYHGTLQSWESTYGSRKST